MLTRCWYPIDSHRQAPWHLVAWDVPRSWVRHTTGLSRSNPLIRSLTNNVWQVPDWWHDWSTFACLLCLGSSSRASLPQHPQGGAVPQLRDCHAAVPVPVHQRRVCAGDHARHQDHDEQVLQVWQSLSFTR